MILNNFNIFFDIEQTIIPSWNDIYFFNRKKIIDFIQNYNIKNIHIFSFAIRNEEDIKYFYDNIKPEIEDVFNVKIISYPTVEQMIETDSLVTGNNFDSINSFISSRGKVGAFASWAKYNFSNQYNVLIDDVVPDKVVTDENSNCKIQFINAFSENYELIKYH